MKKDLPPKEAPNITAEACGWIAQLETGQLTPADLDAFREWINRSPRHAAEIRQLAFISKDLNILSAMADPINEAAVQHKSIMQPHSRQPLIFSPFRKTALMVSILMVLSISFFLLPKNMWVEQPLLVETDTGGYQEIELEDGTIIKLNTKSQIEVDYDAKTRKVRLLSGEAYFDVSPNPNRPFLVYADNQHIRAVGTAFVVRLLEEDFSVTVVEGKVEVAETASWSDYSSTHPDANNSSVVKKDTPDRINKPIALEQGQKFNFSNTKRVSSIVNISERDLQRELSWQEGLLDFTDMPLEEVVKEFSRYTSMNIEFIDPELRNIKFGGIFRTGESSAFFTALENSYGINVTYISSNKITLNSVAK